MILVTGARGMVGTYLTKMFDPAELCLTDIDSLDITDYDAVVDTFYREKPDTVIHLAATTHVDECELNYDKAYMINAIGTQNIALACRLIGAKMVYLSTGAMFKGDRDARFTEFDEPEPVNAYAISKFEGENFVRRLAPRWLIVRTGWVIGRGAGDYKFLNRVLEQLRAGEEVRAVDDKWGCLTYAPDLIKRLKELIDLDLTGVFHVTNEGSANRFEIVEQITSCLGIDHATLVPIKSDVLGLPAKRSDSEVIVNYKMALLGLPPMRPWQEALRDCLESGGTKKW